MDLRSSTVVLFCIIAFVQGNPISTVKNFLELIDDLHSNCTEIPLLDELLKVAKLYQCEKSDLSNITKLSLNCLSVLDISRRLCQIKNASSLNLPDHLKVEQAKNITTDQICVPESGITFESIPEYPHYKENMKRIFYNKEMCMKLCFSDIADMLETGPNYFCKVVYYGTAILKYVERLQIQQNETMKSQAVEDTIEQTSKTIEVTNKLNTSTEGSKSGAVENFEKKNSTASVITTTTFSSTKLPVSATQKQNLTGTGNQAVQEHESMIKPPISGNFPVITSTPVANLNPKKVTNPKKGANPYPKLVVQSASTEEKPNFDNNQDYDMDNNRDEDISEDVDNAGDIPDLLPKPDPKMDPETIRENASPYVEMIDGEDIEDDGGFFPVFFLGIATMVLMYILYHNKNKIMGLLIEGRNSGGRRRTSRGHAYRRLDTLEQAMTTHESTVTPSKIIY